jgi:hypothetical protein
MQNSCSSTQQLLSSMPLPYLPETTLVGIFEETAPLSVHSHFRVANECSRLNQKQFLSAS